MYMYFSFLIFGPDQCPKAHVLCCNCFLELSFPQHWMCWKQARIISSFMVSVFQVIKDFFPSILALAQVFLHSAHPAVVSFGSCMYKQAFAAFDSYCQQVQCDGWQLFYLGLHFVLECMSWSFRGQGFRQLEAFGGRSVPKSRPRRRWGAITARLVASDSSTETAVIICTSLT